MATSGHEGYKANLLQSARYLMAKSGGSVRLEGSGNHTHVVFKTADGRACVVWFPVEPRVGDCEVADMKDAIREMSGSPAFTL